MFRAAFRRLLAIDDPPERTALAFSIGVFIAFSPFLGLHTIMATAVAFLFRFNKIAIYTGTFINNPFFTLIPIIIVSYAVGAFILGRPLRIPDEGLELLKNPSIFSGDYYRPFFRPKLAHRLALYGRRNGPLGGLFGTGISDNIARVAAYHARATITRRNTDQDQHL